MTKWKIYNEDAVEWAIGAGLAGWEHIVAVESDTENGYIDIGEKRMQYWLKEQK